MSKIELFGHDNCPACKLIKTFLEKNNVAFDYVDIWNDPDYTNDCGVRSVPTIIVESIPYVNPSMSMVKGIINGDMTC